MFDTEWPFVRRSEEGIIVHPPGHHVDEEWLCRPVRDETEAHAKEVGWTSGPNGERVTLWANYVLEPLTDD